jgi:hypothetical protein
LLRCDISRRGQGTGSLQSILRSLRAICNLQIPGVVLAKR